MTSYTINGKDIETVRLAIAMRLEQIQDEWREHTGGMTEEEIEQFKEDEPYFDTLEKQEEALIRVVNNIHKTCTM